MLGHKLVEFVGKGKGFVANFVINVGQVRGDLCAANNSYDWL